MAGWLSVTTLNVSEDDSVDEAYPTTTHNFDYSREEPTPHRNYIHLKFDISGIDTSRLTACTLNMYCVGNGLYVAVQNWGYYARRVTSAWSEGSITWNNKPSYSTVNQSAWNMNKTSGNWIPAIDILDLIKDETSGILSIVLMEATPCTYPNMDWDIANKGHSTGNIPYLLYTESVPTDFYVKASGGSDSNSGASWAAAWATIDHAMTYTPTTKQLHVGFGSYTGEPANNDISPIAANVTVIYETASTGGGTGKATVEVN